MEAASPHGGHSIVSSRCCRVPRWRGRHSSKSSQCASGQPEDYSGASAGKKPGQDRVCWSFRPWAQVTGKQSRGGCKRNCFSDGLQLRKQFKVTLPVQSTAQASSASGAADRSELRHQSSASLPSVAGHRLVFHRPRDPSTTHTAAGHQAPRGQCVHLGDSCSHQGQPPGVLVSCWQPWPRAPWRLAVRAGLPNCHPGRGHAVSAAPCCQA